MSQKAYQCIFSSDIFNTEQKPPETERAHKAIHSQQKSDVFNQSEAKEEKTLTSKRGSKSQSDIFFRNKVEVKEHDRDKRNMPHRSIVFSHLKSKDYVVNKLRDGKIYDPSGYYKEESPVKRRLKELYSEEELNHSDSNISNRTSTSKGFLQKEQESQQPIKKIRERVNKRNFFWEMAKNTSNCAIRDNASSQVIRMANLKSNIFNDPQKEKNNSLNITVGRGITYSEKATPSLSPKHVERSKWTNKLDWKSPQTEILFKTANDKEEEQRSAFQRKHNQLYGSVPDFRNLPKEKEALKENIDSYLPEEYHKADKARRAYDNVSTAFDENFYKKNMKYTGNDHNDHEYLIQEENGVDIKEIKQMLDRKGIHVYDVVDDSSLIFGKSAYRFKVRENDKESFNQTFNEISEKVKKEKGIEIKPIKRITVNKLKPHEFSSVNNKEKPTKPIEKHNSACQIIKKKKPKFSKEFHSINKTYKNDWLTRYQSIRNHLNK